MPSGQKPISAPESICVLRLSAIGDCCHTLPVVRTLQAHWPTTQITWIVGRTEYGLLKDASGIEFITFDKRDGLIVMTGGRYRAFPEWKGWKGQRAQAGKVVPKGFPRGGTFSG